MSRTTRILVIELPMVLTLAVLGCAVLTALQVQTDGRASLEPAAQASTGTTQPLNPSPIDTNDSAKSPDNLLELISAPKPA